jgi:hypothetical protein
MYAQNETTYPRFWDWDADGDLLEGDFVGAGQGYTQQGQRTFVTVNVNGEPRTLWLFHAVLGKLFAREVDSRTAKRIETGERIIIRRLGMRESGTGRTYLDFRGSFPDGPQKSQADLFGSPDDDLERHESQAESAAQPSVPPQAKDDHGTPF